MRLFKLVPAASLAFTGLASAQYATKAPTAEDWAAMAKLPDFNGVWEVGLGGGGRGGRGAAATPVPDGAAPAARGPAQNPQNSWQKTDSSIALLNHGRIVWQFNYGKDARKPYFHPVALNDGTVLTCLSPHDHPWHLALWFSWDKLNGVQYWEYDKDTGWPPGRTEVADAKVPSPE